MASHHENHTNEKKPVSFTVPIILGLVTTAVILSLVALGDPCCCTNCSTECAEACATGDHSQHPGEGVHATEATDAHGGTSVEEHKSADSPTKESGEEAQKPEGGH